VTCRSHLGYASTVRYWRRCDACDYQWEVPRYVIKGGGASLGSIGSSFRKSSLRRSYRMSRRESSGLIPGDNSQPLIERYATCAECGRQQYTEQTTRRFTR
jgi:hypothetical protein